MSFLENVRVVIGKLFARHHVANRLDPDPAILDNRVAIRIARVIDEARIVPVDRSVDDDIVVDREKVRVVTLAFVIGITRIGLSGRQALASVLDQPRSRGNPLGSKSAQPLNG